MALHVVPYIMTQENVQCKVFNHVFDGNVYQRKVRGTIRWVADLQCGRCGTWRQDVMTPRTCELVSRTYVHPDEYNTKLTPREAKKILYKRMLSGGKVGWDDVS